MFLRGSNLLMFLLIEAMIQTQNLGVLLVEVVDGIKSLCYMSISPKICMSLLMLK